MATPTVTKKKRNATEPDYEADLEAELTAIAEGGDIETLSPERLAEAIRFLPRWPILRQVSGMYQAYGRPTLRPPFPLPLPTPFGRGVEDTDATEMPEAEEFDATLVDAAEDDGTDSLFPIPFPVARETLCMDVDGRYPQMTASGTIRQGLRLRLHWIASLRRLSSTRWRGRIWHKDGATAFFPYTQVDIRVVNSFYPWTRRAIVTFLNSAGRPGRTRHFRYRRRECRSVNFEFDVAAGTTAVTSVRTHAHPNRPPTMPNELLTIQEVYRRSGFAVSTNSRSSVPLSVAGTDRRWSDMEMHDAMQVYWSRFRNAPQWAMWVFFAALHERGTSLGGIMFDDIGPNHRQGTAIFEDSFINNAPAGDPNPAAWVRRMKFWTACHEMGHAFNLAHSWQKELGTSWHPSVHNESLARSFMNYPYNVPGGQSAFFSDFEYRFSNQELLFMRHAPERFVQMGNADWFDDHAFEQAELSAEPAFELSLRVNRDTPEFEFLEPVGVELKLKNISDQPHLMPVHLLEDFERVTIIIKKRGKAARQYVPFAQYCHEGKQHALMPDDATYHSVFIAAGRNGWDLSEPGHYTLQAQVRVNGEDVVSQPLSIRVTPPQGYDDEFIAQDFFSDEVGRVLDFGGSNVLVSGNNTLKEAVDRLPNRRVALHAQMALASAQARPCKILKITDDASPFCAAHDVGGAIKQTKANESEAKAGLKAALTKDPDVAADTFGHIALNALTKRFTDWLSDTDKADEAAKITGKLRDVLEKRGVTLKPVLDDLKKRKEKYTKN